MESAKAWFTKRVLLPIKEVVQGGITPQKLALSVALGCVAGGEDVMPVHVRMRALIHPWWRCPTGVWPVVGTTSVIAVLFMFLFPVNGVIVQTVNLLLTAVDVLLVRFAVAASAAAFALVSIAVVTTASTATTLAITTATTTVAAAPAAATVCLFSCLFSCLP